MKPVTKFILVFYLVYDTKTLALGNIMLYNSYLLCVLLVFECNNDSFLSLSMIRR